jgi:aldehyde oxidoreductase
VIQFKLNGKRIRYDGNPEKSLLKYLREELMITTPKDGCSGEGSCGACTVEVDGRPTLSCTTPMKRVAGKKVITTDGMGMKLQEAFAHAFVKMGGVQCGFCTPGIVISAKSLLAKNPNPTREQVLATLNRHLCRCTGYHKIVDSILLAAKIIAGKKTLPKLDGNKKQMVGSRQGKYGAAEAVLGKRPYVADMHFPGMLFGALKSSDHPRAMIIKIDVAAARKMTGVKQIITATDVPGERVQGLIKKDWPVLLREGDVTRYIGDVLALVIADSDQHARAAVKKIEVEYEVLTPLTTVDRALNKYAPHIHPGGNTLSTSRVERGDDAVEALANSAYISRGDYYTPRIEHAFIGVECAVALPDKDGGITLYSEGQGIYEDRRQIASLLNLHESLVDVIQVENGGGFGGKEDLLTQGYAALGAYLTGAAVKVELNRSESIRMHPKRHPMRMRYAVGCDKKGKLTVLVAEIHGDTGAYASVGMKVLERAAGHATGAYSVPNVLLNSTAVYTNNVPCGAMRGFGVNQTNFAMESCIDDLCNQGGFDRWKFRYNNALVEGSITTTGQKLTGKVGVRPALKALKSQFYNAKYAGLACGIKNTGVGNGMSDTSQAKIVVEKGGKITLYHGWTEMGQGVHTIALMVFCQETGIDPKLVTVKNETMAETVCGMTTASRATSLVGHAVIDACIFFNDDYQTLSLKEMEGREYLGCWSFDLTSPIGQEQEGVGHLTHYSYSYAAQLVTLDNKGEIKKVYAAHDAGRIMNPTLFEGQIEGAIHMGLGYAISEHLPMKDGYLLSERLGSCGILRSKEMPPVEVIGIEVPDENGPYGAKGVGEIGLVPTASAFCNALAQFDGRRRYSLPVGKKGSIRR